MSAAFSRKLDTFATPLCHVCCNWIATKLYFAGETRWVYIRFQTGLNKTLMKCAIGSNWFTCQLRVNQRKDLWVCMEPTDCRAGKDFRNNLIQPPLLLIRKVTTREGKGLTQGHIAGSNFVCFKNLYAQSFYISMNVPSCLCKHSILTKIEFIFDSGESTGFYRTPKSSEGDKLSQTNASNLPIGCELLRQWAWSYSWGKACSKS